MNKDEQIADQQATSENETQTPESSTQGQSENADGTMPEKFAGKSATEIYQAYREIEKDRGRLASELGNVRKEREDMESRFRNLEQAVARYNYQPTPQVTQEAQPDPFEVLEKTFDENPKQAIKEALRLQQEVAQRQYNENLLQQQALEGSQYYWNQKKENPDYARREPMMQELKAMYQDIIRPEFVNSKKVLEALDLMSRGRDIDYYSQQAVAKAQKNGSSVREEKRRAQSESSTSEGEQLKDTTKMSAAEFARYKGLKRADE